MVTLTETIPVPNITRIRLRRVQIDDVENVLRATIDCGTQGAGTYASLMFEARDGACNGARKTVSPSSYTDRVEGFTMTLPTGMADAYAAYSAGAGRSIGVRAQQLETWAISVGLLPAGTVS